jgi:hypothetical protein
MALPFRIDCQIQLSLSVVLEKLREAGGNRGSPSGFVVDVEAQAFYRPPGCGLRAIFLRSPDHLLAGYGFAFRTNIPPAVHPDLQPALTNDEGQIPFLVTRSLQEIFLSRTRPWWLTRFVSE